jgi:hypothetical protein
VQKWARKSYNRRSSVVEVDVIVWQLITPAVRDAVTNTMIEAGSSTDDPDAWEAYKRRHFSRYYAIAKRALSRRKLVLVSKPEKLLRSVKSL